MNGLSKSCGCARRVTEDAKRERIRKYKHQYFQDHKDELIPRHTANTKRLVAEQREKYGLNVYYICSKYKMNVQEYLDLVHAQHNKCAICNIEFDPSSKETVACVDHDHQTGKVRGLLCRQCNSAIGLLHDNVELCLNAYKYLKEYEYEKACVDSEDRMEETDRGS